MRTSLSGPRVLQLNQQRRRHTYTSSDAGVTSRQVLGVVAMTTRRWWWPYPAATGSASARRTPTTTTITEVIGCRHSRRRSDRRRCHRRRPRVEPPRLRPTWTRRSGSTLCRRRRRRTAADRLARTSRDSPCFSPLLCPTQRQTHATQPHSLENNGK